MILFWNPSRSVPYVTLGLALVAFFAVPAWRGDSVSILNGFNIFQNLATYGVAALGLALIMLIGEFDLSVSATLALGAMLAVLTGVQTPVLGLLVAAAAGTLVGLVQGALVARLGVGSMPVTVGGYIALVGLVRILGKENSVGYENFGVGTDLDARLLSVFSPRSLIVLCFFVVVGAMLRYSRWGRDVRAVGGARRASRTTGVRVNRVIVGTFAFATAAVAVSGGLLGYSLATATPDLASIDTLIFAATAALIGGVALTGGRGTVLGVLCGAMTLSVIQEMLAVTAAPAYASALVIGGLLVLTSVLTAPRLGPISHSVLRRRGSIRSAFTKPGLE